MKLNLRTKLIGSFVIILLLMVVVGLMGTHTSKTIRDRLDNIIEQDLKPANILGDVARRAGFVRSNSLLHLLTRSIDDMNRYESEVADWVGKVNTDLNTLKNIFKDQATLDKLAEFRTAWETYLRVWREQVVPLSRANRDEEAFTLARKMGAGGMAAREAMYKLGELHNVNVAAASHSLKLAKQDSRKSQYILSAVILLAIILGLAFGIRQGSRITGPVNTVSKAAQLVAAGDLDQRVMVKTGDEIESMANSFNTMTVKLKTMVEELQREITGRSRAEEELRKYRDYLEELVQDRTEALRESEGKYRNLTESLDELVYRADTETLGSTYVNRAVEGIYGYTVEEWLGDPTLWGSAIHPEDKERVFAWLTESQRKMKSGTVEYRIIRKDKTERWVEDHVSWEKDQQGNVVSLNGVLSDITERKQAEEERKKLEEQFRQSQKMEAIGTLTGGIAHDFNNLLTIIIGNAQLALMDVIKDESLRKEIEEIKKAGDRAASLTRQLLAFSRKQIITPRVLDLNELLTGIGKMLGRLIGEDVELLTIPEPVLWQVEVDPGQMEQVIMNMAINAKDAMPQGGKLTIETANTDLDENYFRKHGIEGEKPGHYVMLAVSDTGIGMDKETLEHIFEPFFTTKEVGKGTGLGLSTVYGIVKQNNGFVWVYSEPGQGSTFKVHLPKAEGDADLEEKQRLPVIELDGSETVLIVEDNDGLRKFAQEVLLLHGYRVLDAENGEDALMVSQAHEGPIHLMITDVVMPRMGGKEAADRLQPLYPQMKVVYMSGYTDNAIVRHGVLAPGLNFLQKPFTPESLARKVRGVLDAEKK